MSQQEIPLNVMSSTTGEAKSDALLTTQQEKKENEEFDTVATFRSIDYGVEAMVLIFGLAIGFIVAIVTGEYDVILPIGVSLTFLHLLWNEWYGEKNEIKIDGELKDDINDSLKKPEDVEFYLRSDFLDRLQRPRGSTMVYVLRDAPGALMVHQHRMFRVAGYRGFEIGGGIGSLLAFILSVVASAFFILAVGLSHLISAIFFVILLTFVGCLFGAAIEIQLRKKKWLFPVNETQTTIYSIPFYSMGNIETFSIGLNEAQYFSASSWCIERFFICWFKFVSTIYLFWIHLVSISFINSFITLWIFVTAVLALLFYAHVQKDPSTLYAAFILSWITFIFSVFMTYYFSSPACCRLTKLPRLAAERLAAIRTKLFIVTTIISILIFVSALIVTLVTSHFHSLKIVVDNTAWKALNLKLVVASGSTTKSADICSDNNYRALVAAIVFLCLVWIIVPFCANRLSKFDKNPQGDNASSGAADFQNIFPQWKWRQFAEVIIHRRTNFGVGQAISTWLDILTLRIWRFNDQHLRFPYHVELTKSDAQELQQYLVKKLTFYRPIHDYPNPQEMPMQKRN